MYLCLYVCQLEVEVRLQLQKSENQGKLCLNFLILLRTADDQEGMSIPISVKNPYSVELPYFYVYILKLAIPHIYLLDAFR